MPFDPDSVREFERAGWNRAAAARGAIVTGLDFSPAMLQQARARSPSIAFDHGDAEAPPHLAARFDAVVSNFGIHHVPRPTLALAEVHRVPRPHARFAFTVWTGQADDIAWRLVFGAIGRQGDPLASNAPPPGGGLTTTADCLSALEQAGFSDATARLVPGAWRHRDAAALLNALKTGTARMAALIEARIATGLLAILDDLQSAAAPYWDGAGLAVPIAYIIAAGTRP